MNDTLLYSLAVLGTGLSGTNRFCQHQLLSNCIKM